MKKLISVVFCIVFMFTAVSADGITAENTDYNYIIDGKVQKLPEGESGFSYKDRTYVPLRYLAELFKFNVSWDGDTETISIDTKNGTAEISRQSRFLLQGATPAAGPWPRPHTDGYTVRNNIPASG